MKAAEATAENRVLIATVRAMQEECHTFKVRQPFTASPDKEPGHKHHCIEKLSGSLYETRCTLSCYCTSPCQHQTGMPMQAHPALESHMHVTSTMRHQVNSSTSAQDLQQRAEAKVAGLEAQIAMLKDQIASLQACPAL